jgi:hypothetical protein
MRSRSMRMRRGRKEGREGGGGEEGAGGGGE